MEEVKDAQEANKTILEEMQSLIKRKEAAELEHSSYRKPKYEDKQKPKITIQTSKMETTPKSYLQAFEDKLVKDFGLTVKIDSYGWHQLYYKTFKVFELVPRKGFRFGVYREDPEQDNKWKCFRVTSDDDQNIHYAFASEFVKINSQ